MTEYVDTEQFARRCYLTTQNSQELNHWPSPSRGREGGRFPGRKRFLRGPPTFQNTEKDVPLGFFLT